MYKMVLGIGEVSGVLGGLAPNAGPWTIFWRIQAQIYLQYWNFGRQMLNDMPMVMQMWKSKPEVEFQHGGRLFSENGSSNISAVDWDISPKLGMQVDFDLPKWVTHEYRNRK